MVSIRQVNIGPWKMLKHMKYDASEKEPGWKFNEGSSP